MSPPDGRSTVEVRVALKPGVFDAEADGVLKSLRLLSVDHLVAVGTARVFRLEFEGIPDEEAHRRAELAVDRLLANPIVHRVTIGPVERSG